MNVTTLFETAKYFQAKGRNDIYFEVLKECVGVDRNFSAAFIELSNVNRLSGNVIAEKESLISFLNCAQTAFTLDLIPQVKGRIQEIDRILTGQQPQPAQPQVVK